MNADEDHLEAMRDQQLNELFANQVCNYSMLPSVIDGVMLCGIRGTSGTGAFALPSFCTNANAVLPWLEKWHTTAEHIPARPLPWHVRCEDDENCYVGRAATFCRAAVLAVLRAKGVERGKAP